MAKRIAVLGEMLELGADAAQQHHDLGLFAAEQGIDLVVAVGGINARILAAAAGAAGVPDVAIVGDNKTATAFVASRLEPGDTVLVKGSRGGMHWQIAQQLAGQSVAEWGDWNRNG
ncbi:UDP-N-acetylmuramoylalanyl-D-glutamate--2,6-diaminopimelate ligase [Streptomyces sp. BPTC-684]|uniref:glutamate ligase domain-containing protein n=1 Tax=Streptomyces sp. BPTC-684 TaxID=3043734 RepID=UPI0024B2006C|nr:UDP-N-acetylmuramoylalanyl-D-glutamate--2,6-diaminopimelate ligase [Streptomyces sp. BPTC-684]WHM36609.1 UDP-N-acetylmuramoylalanyl-D-glutamate--2,6-diaminopimelate ligase [Streptomyces sp. BPTC-684]